jgi:hypothetical protein
MYTWQKDFLFPLAYNDWTDRYKAIYVANTILDNIGSVKRDVLNQVIWNNVKGQALYFRAKSFFEASIIWANEYDSATSTSDLGLPLRLNTNFNEISVRSTIGETYNQIIEDLKNATSLLPTTPIGVYRPSKPAAFGLLARTYLSMRDYEKAGLYADSCLNLYSALIDFNAFDTNASYPIPRLNSEVIMESSIPAPDPIYNTVGKIDSLLYNSYDNNDLRKTIFFKSNTDSSYRFTGSYEHSANLFSGIATDEMYLIRAESYARSGNTGAAINDLNTLLLKRWRAGTFVPYTAINAKDALDKILLERRKELLMRGLRWMDLKRLNKEAQFAITLRRIIGGETYTLPPNDPRYAMPIPEDLVPLSGIIQNPR